VGNEWEFPVLRQRRLANDGGACPLRQVAAEALRRYADEASSAAHIGAGECRRTCAERTAPHFHNTDADVDAALAGLAEVKDHILQADHIS
jgi:hypothetical protein